MQSAGFSASCVAVQLKGNVAQCSAEGQSIITVKETSHMLYLAFSRGTSTNLKCSYEYHAADGGILLRVDDNILRDCCNCRTFVLFMGNICYSRWNISNQRFL